MGAESQAPLRLYRGLLRLSRLLPKDARAYYQEYARENFVAFSDEPGGGERAVELLARGREHGLWVAKKYSVDSNEASRLLGMVEEVRS